MKGEGQVGGCSVGGVGFSRRWEVQCAWQVSRCSMGGGTCCRRWQVQCAGQVGRCSVGRRGGRGRWKGRCAGQEDKRTVECRVGAERGWLLPSQQHYKTWPDSLTNAPPIFVQSSLLSLLIH